ncbi:unnamed protein product [Sphagnum balticum]
MDRAMSVKSVRGNEWTSFHVRPKSCVSPLVEFVFGPEDRTYYGAENPGPDSLPHHQRGDLKLTNTEALPRAWPLLFDSPRHVL